MLLKINKILFLVMLFYQAWFQVVFFQINYFLHIVGFLMMASFFIDITLKKIRINKIFNIEIILWIIFGLVVFTFGYFNAYDKALHISSTIDYFQFLSVLIVIVYISLSEKKIDFFVNSFIALSFVCAISTIIIRYDYHHGRITMGPKNNPNTLGIMMAYGIGFLLFKLNFKSFSRAIIIITLIMLFTYVTFLSGSRKSFLSICILFFLWIIMLAIPLYKKMKLKSKLKYLLILLLSILLISNFIIPIFENSLLFNRLLILFKSPDQGRIGMYNDAWRIFKEYPLFGVGMQQYRVVSVYQTYSHSTYAEAIANTGIIGSILYFSVYFILALRYIKIFFNKTLDIEILKKFRIMIFMFAMTIFLGIGVIHFYDLLSFVFFGVLISYIHIYESKGGTKGVNIYYH